MRARRRLTNFVCLAACALFCALAGPARADGHRLGSVSLFLRDFVWREYDPRGTQLLEEDGLLIGGMLRGEEHADWIGRRYGLSTYIGVVDYRGSTQSGVAATSDTGYVGGSAWIDAMPLHVFDDGSSVRAYLGIAGELWNRSINDGTTASGEAVFGYTETWFVLQPRTGVGATLAAGQNCTLHADGLLKLPGLAWNMVDLNRFGIDDVTVNPEPDISFAVETGIAWKRLAVTVAYETVRYGESDRETAGDIFQPESKANLLTFAVGLRAPF